MFAESQFSTNTPPLLSLAMLYIDPVSGSIAVQAFLAGIVGGVTFFHRSIGRLLRRLFRRSDPHDPADQ